ncbi:MAG: RidA family protein [Blautia sp.]
MKMEEIVSKELAPALGPYCHGRKYGNILVTSGSIPEKKDGSFVFEIKEATKLTLQNLLSVVEAAGGTRENIARVEVYLKTLDDFAAMNEAYAEFFGEHKPARVCYQVADLACGVPIEAALTAFIDE